MISAQIGHPPPPAARLPIPPGVAAFPQAGSCAHCQREETAEPDFTINRCGKCRLTRSVVSRLSSVHVINADTLRTGTAGESPSLRFPESQLPITCTNHSSVKCQKADWARHKNVCPILIYNIFLTHAGPITRSARQSRR